MHADMQSFFLSDFPRALAACTCEAKPLSWPLLKLSQKNIQSKLVSGLVWSEQSKLLGLHDGSLAGEDVFIGSGSSGMHLLGCDLFYQAAVTCNPCNALQSMQVMQSMQSMQS